MRLVLPKLVADPRLCLKLPVVTITGIPASQNNLHIYYLAGKLARAIQRTEMSTSLLLILPLGTTCKATRIG